MKIRTKPNRNLEQLIADAPHWRQLHRPGHPPRILADQKLRAFIDRALLTMTFVQIAAACRKKFGPDRAPGKSAIQRYWEIIVASGLVQRPVSEPARRRYPVKTRAAALKSIGRGGRVAAKTR